MLHLRSRRLGSDADGQAVEPGFDVCNWTLYVLCMLLSYDDSKVHRYGNIALGSNDIPVTLILICCLVCHSMHFFKHFNKLLWWVEQEQRGADNVLGVLSDDYSICGPAVYEYVEMAMP